VSVFGVDYADGRPGATALKAAGVKFVCRYLSHTSAKNLSRTEAGQLSDAGIWVVVVWETTADRALAGHAAGVADATAARQQADACGMPDGRPIYFAVDWDASSGQQAAINAYLDGAASVLGRGRVGLYAGYSVIKRAFDAKKIAYGWQTYAWSGGRWDSRAQLQQYSNDHLINGVGCDYDRATKDDYGQWKVGVSPTKEDDMPTPKEVWEWDGIPAPPWKAAEGNTNWPPGTYLHWLYRNQAKQTELLAKMAAGEDVDVDAIVAGVLTGLAPDKIAELVAANLPPDLAKQVADDLVSRLEN
jgi:hypothetical protein